MPSITACGCGCIRTRHSFTDRSSIGASFLEFHLMIAARIRPGSHSLLSIRRGLRHCDPAIGQRYVGW
jgi:hypothetical protein